MKADDHHDEKMSYGIKSFYSRWPYPLMGLVKLWNCQKMVAGQMWI
jgi:hypothetical protein